MNHLPSVQIDGGQILLELNLDVNVMVPEIGLNESQRVGNQFLDLTGFRAARPLLAEIEHPFGHFFDAARSALDDLEIDAQRMVCRKAFYDKANVPADEHQWIIDLVRKACRQFADRDET